ncbi:hypothetical protein [Pseudoxanthomonas mexicana]|uniref:hypothetical protein n=1 Tax=Pseudoxanthomonas mexicana TaxID=128785 RepID=UPI00398A8276
MRDPASRSFRWPQLAAHPFDPILCALLLTGIALVLLLPFARGPHPLLGWLPLWLVGMPAAAWWALHRFRLPAWPMLPARPAIRPRRVAAAPWRRRQALPRRRLRAA